MILLVAAAFAWSPLRVALDCQTQHRVDLCTLARGTLDPLNVVSVVPKAEAQVVLHLNATKEVSTDYVQLRAVSSEHSGVAGTPSSFEQEVAIDYRLSVDEQRAALAPPLLRVLAPYLSLAVPGSVSITLVDPEGGERVEKPSSPWGFVVYASGTGNWSDNYRALSVWTGGSVTRKTNENLQSAWVGYQREMALQPSLVVKSTEVELTSDSNSIHAGAFGVWNLGPHWSAGGALRGGHEDPEGQYLGTGRAQVGVEYNLFPSDDPRGNVLSATWLVGAQVDHYNQTNTLGEDNAAFPTQTLLGAGEVRFDTITLGVQLSLAAQLAPFFRRHVLGAEVEMEIAINDYVDLELDVFATHQAIPGPASIDSSSYEEVTRASYAEPLSVFGYLSMRFHWDNTNGARNNRFTSVREQDPLAGL